MIRRLLCWLGLHDMHYYTLGDNNYENFICCHCGHFQSWGKRTSISDVDDFIETFNKEKE